MDNDDDALDPLGPAIPPADQPMNADAYLERWPTARGKVELAAGVIEWQGEFNARDIETAQRTYPGREVWIDDDGYLLIAPAGNVHEPDPVVRGLLARAGDSAAVHRARQRRPTTPAIETTAFWAATQAALARHGDALDPAWDRTIRDGLTAEDSVAARRDLPPAPVRVTAVRIVRGRVLRVVFADGVERVVDLAPLLTGPVFGRIGADDETFATMYVDPELGVLAWPGGPDIAPEALRLMNGVTETPRQ